MCARKCWPHEFETQRATSSLRLALFDARTHKGLQVLSFFFFRSIVPRISRLHIANGTGGHCFKDTNDLAGALAMDNNSAARDWMDRCRKVRLLEAIPPLIARVWQN